MAASAGYFTLVIQQATHLPVSSGDEDLAVDCETNEHGIFQVFEKITAVIVDFLFVAKKVIGLAVKFAGINRPFRGGKREKFFLRRFSDRTTHDNDRTLFTVRKCRD